MALQPIIVSEPFDDRDGDGRILFGTTNRKKYGTSEVTYKPELSSEGHHVYWPKGYAPAVEAQEPEPAPAPAPTPAPAPVEQAPSQEVIITNREAFIRKGDIMVGFNAQGGIGTDSNGPAHWAKVRPNYGRVGLRSVKRNIDPIIAAANVEEFMLDFTRDGRRVRLSNVAGREELANATVSLDGTWTAEAQGLRVVQKPVLTVDGVQLVISVINTGSTPVSDLRYLRSVDFTDYDRVMKTINRIVAPGQIECVLQGTTKGAVAYLRTEDPSFSAVVHGFINEDIDALPAPQKVGYSVTSDAAANLVGRLGGLAAGASTRFAIEIGVR